MKTRLITAICTPLHEDHSLFVESLESHIEDQWHHGISGLLVGGTMGLMQLQTDNVLSDLVKLSVLFSRNRGEILVGVGDTCFARTLERIRIAEQFAIDGVVVLSPYLLKYSQTELIDYFRSLADVSSKPLYLYDLPAFTGTTLELSTVKTLAAHRNICGIKCSGAWEDTRQLIDSVGDQLRVIPAQAHLIDQLVRVGVPDNLDGIFGIFPHLPTAIVQAAESDDWMNASKLQQKLSQLLQLVLKKYATAYGCCEAILNARGIPGQITVAPMRRLSGSKREELLSEPLIQELIRNH